MNQRCALCTLPGEVARLKADNQILTRDLTKLIAKIDRVTNEMRTVVKALSIEVVQFEQRFVRLLKESRAGSESGQSRASRRITAKRGCGHAPGAKRSRC
jgi:hypothetical protein